MREGEAEAEGLQRPIDARGVPNTLGAENGRNPAAVGQRARVKANAKNNTREISAANKNISISLGLVGFSTLLVAERMEACKAMHDVCGGPSKRHVLSRAPGYRIRYDTIHIHLLLRRMPGMG